jgi:tetratricopeptide (TPR) repeat protein
MDLSNARALLIDDRADMREALRVQLAQIGIVRCDVAPTVPLALERFAEARGRYELILCDYYLGEGADGQQLLELARRRRLLPAHCVFLMISAESDYASVAVAAEQVPDDYLIKPFPAEVLRQRLLRAFEKKYSLAPVLRPFLAPQPDWPATLAACEALLAQGTRYAADVTRIKGEALLALGRCEEAFELYEQLCTGSPRAWVAVGRAKALECQGKMRAARSALEAAIESHPSYVAAYDRLAGVLDATGAHQDAQAVLARAVQVSPSAQRHRTLGHLALRNGDLDAAEKALKRVIERDRYGFFKSAEDFSGLSSIYVSQGKTDAALKVARQLGQHFKPSPEIVTRQCVMEFAIQSGCGNATAAQAALTRAVAAKREGRVPPELSMEVARICLEAGRIEEGDALVREIASNHQERPEVLAMAQAMYARLGRENEGLALLESVRREMIALNNAAVQLAREGRLDEAVDRLVAAAERMEENATILLNAATALLMWIEHNGAHAERIEKATRFFRAARKVNPEHPRLRDVERHLESAGAAALSSIR